MARKRATLTELMNDLTFRLLFNKYKLLACSAFEWSGFESFGIENRHIESLLFDEGKCAFFKKNDGSYMCLRCDGAGKLNPYGDDLYYNITGLGYHSRKSVDDIVVIKNNMYMYNTYNFVMFYVNKITEAERTMDVNVKTVKTPFVFTCDSKDVFSFKKIFEKIDGNVPVIYADKNLNTDSLNVLTTDSKFLCNDLMDYKKCVENELLTFLGFNNLAVDKKERVNVSEAESNNDVIETFADLQLKARQQACKEINEKFGLNVCVKRKESNNATVSDNQSDNRTS